MLGFVSGRLAISLILLVQPLCFCDCLRFSLVVLGFVAGCLAVSLMLQVQRSVCL